MCREFQGQLLWCGLIIALGGIPAHISKTMYVSDTLIVAPCQLGNLIVMGLWLTSSPHSLIFDNPFWGTERGSINTGVNDVYKWYRYKYHLCSASRWKFLCLQRESNPGSIALNRRKGALPNVFKVLRFFHACENNNGRITNVWKLSRAKFFRFID